MLHIYVLTLFIYHPSDTFYISSHAMCLILFAWQTHPRYPLVVAANRDEFHDRPTTAAGFWEDTPAILAGRDLQAGGTWLGINRNGRFAAISNYREPLFKASKLEYSRGHLVRDFLLDNSAPGSHAEKLQTQGARYRGFNLLLGNPEAISYVSNRTEKPINVTPGSHGLSNHLLDTDWPKVHNGRTRLDAVLKEEHIDPDWPKVYNGRTRLDTVLKNEHIDPEALLELLADKSTASRTRLSTEELQSEPEKVTRMIFINSPVYGTRSSTVLLLDRDGEITFVERQFDANGKPAGTQSHKLRINLQPV